MPFHSILDDPDKRLVIWSDTAFANWRSTGVAKEPWTYEWLSDFDESVSLYNIGACVGTYSLMAAARGADVCAFEPLPVNTEALQRNISLNDLQDKITIFSVALGSQVEMKPFYLSEGLGTVAGYGFLSLKPRQSLNASIRVPVFPLDLIAKAAPRLPTHMLIDVEGAELEVLKGAEDLIFRSPIESMLIEVQSDTESEVISFMEHQDFRTDQVYTDHQTVHYLRFEKVDR